MPLRNYTPPTRQIDVEGGSFSIRGLSVADVSAIVGEHEPDLVHLVDLGDEMRKKVLAGENDVESAKTLAFHVLNRMPGLANTIMGTALAGEDEDALLFEKRHMVSRLPFPIQVQALLAIADMTFREVGGLKKWWADLAQLIPQGAAASLRIRALTTR